MDRQEELTLETLLSDPVTQAVMRSDGVSLAETVKVLCEAQLARMRGPRWQEPSSFRL